MARRTVLTGRQRDALLALPADEPTLLQHHVLSDVDLGHIRRRRRPATEAEIYLLILFSMADLTAACQSASKS